MSRHYAPRMAIGPRGSYRRKKLRTGEQRVFDALRARNYPTVYRLAKDLNAFWVFKIVRNFIRMGLVTKTPDGPRITEKISLIDAGDLFWIPADATQRPPRIGEVVTPKPPRFRIRELLAEATPSEAPDCVDVPALAQPDRVRSDRAEYDQARNSRARPIRARTINVKRMTNREREAGRLLYPEETVYRPKTRGECLDSARPCPYVGCRYHLFLDISKNGSIKLNFPDLEPDELGQSCALDVAAQDGQTLEVVARHLNLTRERLRQIEERALIQLRSFPVNEFDDEGDIRTPTRSHQSRVA